MAKAHQEADSNPPPSNAGKRRWYDFAKYFSLEGWFEPDLSFATAPSPVQAFAEFLKELYAANLKHRAFPSFHLKDEISRSACNAYFNRLFQCTDFANLRFEPSQRSYRKEIFFWGVRQNPDLSSPERIRWITEAAQRNDRAFFERLGKELADGASTLDRVDKLLICHWAPIDAPDAAALCDFTDQALHDYVKIICPGMDISFDQVRKRRQRWKLKKRSPRIHSVKDEAGKATFFTKGGQRVQSVSTP